MLDLSIVIVSYNSKRFLKNCLRSIYENLGVSNFEVIVVDNSSQDGSVSMLKEEFPQVKIIENQKNLGFARANNQALKKCQGKYILLLNPDTELFSTTLDQMLFFMDQHPDAGALGIRTWSDPQKTFQWGADILLTPILFIFEFTLLGKLFPQNRIFKKCWEADRKIFDCQSYSLVETIDGDCLLVRKEILEEVGFLDEDFFMYYEDLDWCRRIKEKGWSLYYLAEAEVVHYAWKSSSNRDEAYRTFLNGMGPYLKKNFGRFEAWLVLFFLKLNGFLLKLAQPLRRRKNIPSPIVLSPANPLITWPRHEAAYSYWLELSYSPHFLHKGGRRVDDTSFLLPDIFIQEWPDGIYYGRVAPLSADGQIGDFYHSWSFLKKGKV